MRPMDFDGRGDISDVNLLSHERDRGTILLHTWYDEIWAFHLQSNGRDLMATICIRAFHQSRWLKMKIQILQSLTIFPINWYVLRRCKPFRGVSSNQTI